jgi:8-oxo-dGTP pyrophosphatase MutT (NUDIX family)
MSNSSAKFWQPDVTVATVVVRNGLLLMVEENAAGAVVLNQPAGHLEPDESIFHAAVRETLEETGWHVELTHFIGAYQWKSHENGQHYLRMAFAATPLRHEPDYQLDAGIIAAHWLSPSELSDKRDMHRSPLVWKLVEDYLAGQRYPLNAIHAL